MKAYIITIIGATLLSAIGAIIALEKWRGYVQLITGLVIISCIISPITSILKSDILNGFESIEENVTNSENIQQDLVIKELEKRINEDISARLEREFDLSVSAECEILVNGDGEIEGVDEIYIYGDKLTDSAKNRLCEVYGLSVQEVHNG